MYRQDTYQRVIQLIHELRSERATTFDYTERIALGIRIENLKNMLTIQRESS